MMFTLGGGFCHVWEHRGSHATAVSVQSAADDFPDCGGHGIP